MDNIQIVKAVQIIGVNDTNSLPLQVLCGDNEIYIIKTMFKKHPPIEDIINEILSNYFLQCWKISVPDQALVLVNDTLIEQYVKSGNKIDKKYEEFLFNDHYFYGSKFLPNATELDLYNLNLKNNMTLKNMKILSI